MLSYPAGFLILDILFINRNTQIKEENSIILNAIENYIKYLDDLKEIVKEQPCLKGFCKNDLLENQDIERESAEIERLMV